MLTYRFGNWLFYCVRPALLRKPLWLVYKIMDIAFVRIVGASEIPAQCQIGAGMCLLHGGNGVVFHPRVKVGNNVTVLQQVTLGTLEPNQMAPMVGDDVFIGAGAKILGPITVGHGAKVGANAVVLRNVPDGATAVGVPARVLIKTPNNP